MILVPLAHAGHWLASVLYVVPVVVVVVALGVQVVREKRREAHEGPAEPDAD
jgi:cytochrome c-type biogenesis protein CcmH/NrfF